MEIIYSKGLLESNSLITIFRGFHLWNNHDKTDYQIIIAAENIFFSAASKNPFSFTTKTKDFACTIFATICCVSDI